MSKQDVKNFVFFDFFFKFKKFQILIKNIGAKEIRKYYLNYYLTH